MNYHAPTYVRFLEEIALSLGVEIRCGARVEGYEHKSGDFVLNVNGEEEHVGRLIVCVGGKSQKNLGSDGLFFDELKRHGYAISPLMPGLCPIKTKEKLKSLSGLRHKAAIRVEANGRAIYGEQGEILFKDDGLSGIAIMNASSYIAHSKERDNIEIHVDLFPQYDSIQLERMMLRVFESSPSFFLDGILERPLKEYVLFSCRLHKKETLEKEDIKAIARALKTMVFHYDSSYPFDASQVTIGGVCLSEIDEVLDSKREKGLFFAGEVLDVDGMCGGYNLSFALLSALEVAAYV